MKITYVFHSCYTVELDHHFIVFDYYKGCLPPFPIDKTIIFFVSHAHYDHYQPVIWELAAQYPFAQFVVHCDVPHPDIPGVWPVSNRDLLEIDELSVQTFRSTDEGVAFLLRVDGVTLYHAGDLNWWHWEGASEKENEHHKRAFFHELEKLSLTPVDVAFLPLDPRQEGNAWWGVKAFLDAVAVKNAFPMHFGEEIDRMNAYLKQELKQYASLHSITRCGEVFLL